MTTPEIETFVDDLITIAHAPGVVGAHLAQRITEGSPAAIGHVGLHGAQAVSDETGAELIRLKGLAGTLALQDVAAAAMAKSGKAPGAFQADRSMVAFFTPDEAEDGFQMCLRYVCGDGTGIATLSFHQHRDPAA